jgi:uncharacterized protein YdeI (YjbR/CyaY-like superfamily)
MANAPRAFKTRDDFRTWLEKNHASENELMIRLYKVHARAKGIGYRDALDEALCFGWIDGVVKSLDEDSFQQRFTPRRKNSKWSVVNIKRAKELQKEGRMHPAGLAAFKARGKTTVAPYSYEAQQMKLDPALEKQLRANRKAWKFFEAQPPYYRRLMIYRIMTARKPETRERRFETLLRYSSEERRLDMLKPNE